MENPPDPPDLVPYGPGKVTEPRWATTAENSMYLAFLQLLKDNKYFKDWYNIKQIFKNSNARQEMYDYLEKFQEDFSEWNDKDAKKIDADTQNQIARWASDLRGLLLHHMSGSEVTPSGSDRPPGPDMRSNLGWVALERRLDRIYRALN